MDNEMLIKNGIRALVLIALIFVLLFLLTFTGVMRCSQLPLFGEAWCDVYWGIKTFVTGSPKVLIVYGDYGLGNPIGPEPGSLKELLEDPEILGVYPDTMPIDRVNFGNLRNYDIVIVEKAKKIETKELRAFIDFAMMPTGGTLIWTGDAGTELGPNDAYAYTTDKDPKSDVNAIIGPWTRTDGEYIISFDELLGLRPVDKYKTTFCELSGCPSGTPFLAGNIETEPSGSHPLIYGISRALPLYIFQGEDFAVVDTLSGGVTNEVLSIDFGSDISSREYDLNRSAPLIVTSGVGERVVYYAMPPELYANPRLEQFGKGRYFLPIENMYYGVIKG